MQYWLTKVLLFILLSHFLPFGAENATAHKAQDSIQVRTIDSLTLQQYRDNTDFQYHDLQRSMTNWEMLWYQIKRWFFEGLFSDEGISIIKFVAISLFILGILFLIIQRRYSSGWFSDKQNKSAVSYLDPDAISDKELEQQLAAAENEGNYRQALRLQYVRLLKNLKNNNLLVWNSELTNRQIEKQLRNWKHSDKFSHLTRWFDYSWYGDFQPQESRYMQLKADFAFLRQEVSTKQSTD